MRPKHAAGKTSGRLGRARIRQELDRILASATFQKVERLKRFISFIVVETIAGRGAQLKEYVVGTEVFGKDPSFDPRNDPIVRVQARRLRARLDHYFHAEGGADEVVPAGESENLGEADARIRDVLGAERLERLRGLRRIALKAKTCLTA